MGCSAVGIQLYQRRAASLPGAFCRPAGSSVGGEKIVAVHAQTGDPVADTARRERVLIASGDVLMGGNCPLIVDHVQYDRCAVNGAEGEGIVKIRFGGGSFADPARSDVTGVPVFGCHGPAHRLGKLGTQLPEMVKNYVHLNCT